MDASGVHLRSDPQSVGSPVLLGDGTAVYGIPYLEPEAGFDRVTADIRQQMAGIATP